MSQEKIKFSVIIPAFNEELSISGVIKNLWNTLANVYGQKYEIIVVNDGSTDNTKEILDNLHFLNLRVYNAEYNRGYGASLKTGVSLAKGEFVAFYDADGQHKPQDLISILKYAENYDMVVGARKSYNAPIWRYPGRRLLVALANYLVNFKIPDLNSGLRVLRKSYFNKFEHLYPNGFSLSTTITLAFLKQGFTVKYVAIDVKKRVGKSSLRVKDGIKAIMLALRMIILFSPFKIFFPASLFLFLFGAVFLFFDVFISHNIGDTSLLLLINSMLVFFFGLLADQVSTMRREMKL